MKCRYILGLVISIAALVQGCATQPELYYWGSYEQLLYDMYKNPGKATAPEQIDKLETDISKATNAQKRVPPGVYAHLGVMYASLGYVEQAESAFSQEIQLYPESRVLIEGMMKRAQGGEG